MIAHAPVVLDIAGPSLSAVDRRRLKHPLYHLLFFAPILLYIKESRTIAVAIFL